MKVRTALLFLVCAFAISGCQMLDSAFCHPRCHSEARASSSLVGYLYPRGEAPPAQNSIPELKLPLRVGLAFLPSPAGANIEGLESAHRDALLERIRQRFADRRFVSQIVLIPDYYLRADQSPRGIQDLRGSQGFDSLKGVQRLYSIDVIALVSYDQVTYRDDNKWSLGYLTIVGAYVLKGSRHDVTTLMDLAVIDPTSKSILLRAGGTDARHGRTTLIDEGRESRQSRAESFGKATDTLIENFDAALVRFESDVREGKADVRVTNRNGYSGGGGALDTAWIALLAGVLLARCAIAGAARRKV
jgi:rhombotail lipoprotein